MNAIQQQYETHPEKYKSLMWEYNLEPKDFFSILNGEKTQGSFNQKWATVRVLENAPYYDAIKLVNLDTLAIQWPEIKSAIFNNTIRRGYEYVLHKRALSTSGQRS